MFLLKPSRLFPKADATTYNFDHTVATGFPRLLPPIRKIGLGRRAVAGMMPSDKQSDGGIARFESSLERDFYVLLEFNRQVTRWDPQPIRLAVHATGTSYVPDVLVTYMDDVRDQSTRRRILYEVKYREELRAKWKEYRPRFKVALAYARSQGWEFKLITEREIRGGGLLWNAKFLLPYIQDEVSAGERALLLRTLAKQGASTPRALLDACSQDTWEKARLLNALWMLVATRAISTDLQVKLTMESEIWA